MSRWFIVPVTIHIEVKVPDNESAYGARCIAETLIHKRISPCTWGEGNPWTASVLVDDKHPPVFAEPVSRPDNGFDEDEYDDEMDDEEYDTNWFSPY